MAANHIRTVSRRPFLATLLALASSVALLLTVNVSVASAAPAPTVTPTVTPKPISPLDICNYTSSRPTIQYGSTGSAVKQAQCYYNYATTGANLTVDGIFGSDTRAKIIHFQQCVGITADGIVGPVTWSNLSYWANSPYYAC